MTLWVRIQLIFHKLCLCFAECFTGPATQDIVNSELLSFDEDGEQEA